MTLMELKEQVIKNKQLQPLFIFTGDEPVILNIYIDKYLENKNRDNLLKVNYYKDKILNSRKYNNEICAKIEKILSKIEVNNEKNVYN